MVSYQYFDQVLNMALYEDEEAKVEITELLRPMIISSIKKYCPIYQEFHDLYQDGILIVLECLKTYDPKYSFLKYVQSYLKYYYQSTYRYLLELDREISTNLQGEDLLDQMQSEMDLEGDYLLKQDVALLYQAMELLTPRQELIVRLYYLEHLSITEIADFLDISYWTVVNTKRRAVKNLYQLLTTDRHIL